MSRESRNQGIPAIVGPESESDASWFNVLGCQPRRDSLLNSMAFSLANNPISVSAGISTLRLGPVAIFPRAIG